MSYDDWKTTEPVPDGDHCLDCGFTKCVCGDEPPEIEPPDPDYGYVPYEETARYREEMADAGRGHLFK